MNTTLALPESILAVDRTKLEKSRTTGEAVLAKLQTRVCASAEDAQTLTDFMNRAHVIVQDHDAEYEQMVRPLLDSKNELHALFKAGKTPWEQIKTCCKKLVADYHTAVRTQQDEARRLAIAAASAGDTATVSAVIAAAPQSSKQEGASVTFEWHAILEDANVLEREFLEVSATKINAFAKQYQRSETIPSKLGIRWERRAKVGVK